MNFGKITLEGLLRSHGPQMTESELIEDLCDEVVKLIEERVEKKIYEQRQLRQTLEFHFEKYESEHDLKKDEFEEAISQLSDLENNLEKNGLQKVLSELLKKESRVTHE